MRSFGGSVVLLGAIGIDFRPHRGGITIEEAEQLPER